MVEKVKSKTIVKNFTKAIDIINYVFDGTLLPGESLIISRSPIIKVILRKNDRIERLMAPLDVLQSLNKFILYNFVDSTLGSSDRYKKFIAYKESRGPEILHTILRHGDSRLFHPLFLTKEWINRIQENTVKRDDEQEFNAFIHENHLDFMHITDSGRIDSKGYQLPASNKANKLFIVDIIHNDSVSYTADTTIIITNDDYTDEAVHRSDSIIGKLPEIRGVGSLSIIADHEDFGPTIQNLADHIPEFSRVVYIGSQVRFITNPMVFKMISDRQYHPYKIDNASRMRCDGVIIDDADTPEICEHAIMAALSGLDVYVLMRSNSADLASLKFASLLSGSYRDIYERKDIPITAVKVL
jgi:hypothetical protein